MLNVAVLIFILICEYLPLQRSFWLVRFVFASDVEIEILSALVRVMRHELASSLKNYTNSYTVGVNVIF